jgi:zinc protease
VEASAAHLEIDLDTRDLVLGNGLRLVTARRAQLPLVAVHLYYRVGSGAEEAGWRGASHFLEHLMFNGSAGYPEGSFDRLIEEVGGAANAYTTEDVTCYHTDLPARDLELLLRLEADRMARLRFSPEGFEAERAVIREERLETVDDDPGGALFEALTRAVYGAGHPYASPVIGSTEDLRRLSLAACERFYARFYRPENALLVIVGDLEHERARELVAATLGRVRKGAGDGADGAWGARSARGEQSGAVNGAGRWGATRLNGSADGEGRRQWIEVGKAAEAPLLAWGWPAPTATDADMVAVELLAEILAGGESSRLERGLVRERGLALGVQAGAPWRLGGSLFSLLVEGDSAAGLVALRAAVEEELRRFRAGGASAAELRRAATRIRAMNYRQAASNGGLAELLGAAVIFHGRVEAVNEHLRRVERVSVEELRRVVTMLLEPAAAVRVRTRDTAGAGVRPDTESVRGAGRGEAPEETGETEEAGEAGEADKRAAADESEAGVEVLRAAGDLIAEPVSAAGDARAPEARKWRQSRLRLRLTPLSPRPGPGGLLLALLPEPRVPLVSLRLVLAAGSSLDPSGGAGLARLTADLLQLGGGDRDAEDVARAVDEMGGTLSASVGREHLSVQLDLLAEHLRVGVGLLADLVLRPRFEEAHLRRERALLAADARTLRDRPEELCDALLWDAVFGEHPYAHPPAGRAGELAAIAADAPRRFHARVVRPENAVLGAVGCFAVEELASAVSGSFAEWGRMGGGEEVADGAVGETVSSAAGEEALLRPRVRPLPPPRRPRGRCIHFLPVPGLLQCQLALGGAGPRSDEREKAALEIANAVLGGTFGSRLNQRLRVELGVCYGAHAAPFYLSSGGLYSLGLSTSATTAATAIEAVIAVLEEFRRQPPRPREIEAARAQLEGRVVENLQSHPAVVAEVTHGLFLGFGTRFREEHYAALGCTGVESVAQAAARIPAEDLRICVVGPPEVEAALRQAATRRGVAAAFRLVERSPGE